MKTPVYLDYAAATPVDRRVADAMYANLVSPSGYANASSGHELGHEAAKCVERARRQVAALVNATPNEIIWTSGATESVNLALIGAARFRRSAGRHIVTSVTEHPAVLESCRHLEDDGFQVTYVTPDSSGIVDPESVKAALTAETILVSLMHVNNEIGVVQDIEAVGRICRAQDVLFHVDAAQSAGRLSIDVRAQSIDLLSLSAHKVYGPKGIGALFLDRKRCRRVEPLFHGGGQERGLRPGTIPTHQIAGMGVAYEIARTEREEESIAISKLREQLWQRISGVPGVLLNGHPDRRVAHILSVSVTGVEGESLIYGLRDLAVSSGSACASATDEPSTVLRCLGRSDSLARSTVRFSLGRWTTAEEVEFAADRFVAAVDHLRQIAPSTSGSRPALA